MTDSLRTLERNNFFYNYFLTTKILNVQDTLDENELMERIMFLARFAWRNHTGYFYDGRIENIVFNYGKKLENYCSVGQVANLLAEIPAFFNGACTFHLATELCEVGGHTRVLYQLLKRNEDRNQAIILTGQRFNTIPKWFLDGVDSVPIITLDGTTSVFEKACLLRQLTVSAKKIILYHHPFDVVPILAFAHDTCPPVLLENHAHSWFWLGSTVADLVFAHSAFHQEFTRRTRPVKNVHLLPVTQIDDVDLTFNWQDKLQAKEKLHINPEKICIITVGTPEKFIPNAEYNFFQTAQKITERFANVELYLIGIHKTHEYYTDNERIKYLGPLADPADYYKAADICLDALPQPSLGGTFYATLIGLACPLHKYGTPNVFNCRNLSESASYADCIGTPQNEAEYLDKLGFLIDHPDVRLKIAEEIRADYGNIYSSGNLARQLKQMLDEAKSLHHFPHTIPDGKYCHDLDGAEIANAGAIQNIQSSINHFDPYLGVLDKLDVLVRLMFRPDCFVEVVQLLGQALKRRVKGLLFGGFHGSHDSVLSPSVSSHSGK